jgi:hypothetical protein
MNGTTAAGIGGVGGRRALGAPFTRHAVGADGSARTGGVPLTVAVDRLEGEPQGGAPLFAAMTRGRLARR